MTPSRTYRCLLALSLAAGLPPAGRVADWPQFRGPNGSGVSKETGLPLEWSATKNLVWKTPLPGPGSSSPIVFGDRVYVTCYSGYGLDRVAPGKSVDLKSPGNLADLKRHLVCVARDSGKVLWTRDVESDGPDQPYKDGNIALHGYASHTPAADESGVYVYFGLAGAAGYSHAGERKWRVSCGKKVNVNGTYGSAASPVLYDNLLIVNACIETAEPYRQGDLVALDKRTGREVWRQQAGGQWSSPLLATAGARPELVVATNRGPWVGLDPATGQRLYSCQGPEYCATPVAHDGVYYVMGGERKAAIRGGGSGDVTGTHKLWEVAGGTRISSLVYHDGHLYWSSDGHIAHCADARTGKSVYRERLGAGGECFASPVVADGRIYYVSREKGTYVVAAKPQYELLAHNRIEDDPSVFNGSPAVSGGRLFLRSDRYLYCIGKK